MVRISLDVPGGLSAPGLARRRVVGDLADTLPDRVSDDLALLVTELVTNSVRHSRVVDGGMIDVEVLVMPGLLRLTVSDPGGETLPHLTAPDRERGGGLGLVVVDTLCSAWGIIREHDGMVRVWCDMLLDGRQLPEAT